MTDAQISLDLVLPGVPDAQDACVRRLGELVATHEGVELAHPTADGRSICIHFDPTLTSVNEVGRLVRAAGGDLARQYGHVTMVLEGALEEDAGRGIEDLLSQQPGVFEASASVSARRVRVEFDRRVVTASQLVQLLDEAGYRVGVGASTGVIAQVGWYRRNRELAWSLCAALVLSIAWFGQRLSGWSSWTVVPLYLVAYVFGAWDLLQHTVSRARRRVFTFDIDLLMLVAAVGAAGLGAWAEGAFLLTLFAIAHALEHYAMDRARGAIRALSQLAPARARVRRNGADVELPVEQIQIDDRVVIRPGERIPVDGVVASGTSAVNQAPVTGESVPVDKGEGDTVFAGTVNGEGALEVRTTKAVGDRTLDRIIKLVEDAQTSKAPTQLFTERFERVFVPLVLITTTFVMTVPPAIGWTSWGLAVYRGLALLVAASPCALALGTPSAVLAGIAQAARRGVLIKGGAYLENLGTLQAVAFDKTGTLTTGRPEVTDVVPFDRGAEDTLVRVAASVERQSQHPLAQAVVRAAEARGLELLDAGSLESLTARGVRATVDGALVEIGSARLWTDNGIKLPADVAANMDRLQTMGRSVMAVRHGARWLGVLGLADQARPGVRSVLDRLRTLKLRPLVMLTGDNRGVAQVTARDVGIDDVRAELMPEDKVTVVRELLNTYGTLAMVGDGVNDAPALAQATVGIAMGGAGTAVALETADVALMADDLSKLPFAIGLSRRAARVIKQNLVISMSVIVLLGIATLAGWAGIGAAVLLHEGSTMIVVANSLTLLTYRDIRV